MEDIHKYHANSLPQRKIYVPTSRIVPQPNMVYVNKNMVTSLQSTVLVNPNFNRQVHVNPNFASKANKVYVNPNVFNKSNQSTSSMALSKFHGNGIMPDRNRNSSIFVTKFAKINNISQASKDNKPHLVERVLKTKTKLIRIPASKPIGNTSHMKKENIKMSYTPYKSINPLTPKTKTIVTRHKLIKIVQSPSTAYKRMSYMKQKSLRSDMRMSPSRFKLDHRRQPGALIKSRYKLTRKAYMMRLDPQNTIIKKTKFKLVRCRKMASQKVVNRKSVSNTNSKSPPKRTALKLRKSFKKINIPCEVYNRRGFCKLQASGKCQKKHNPNQIQICIWFLQGLCLNQKCRLSHKVSLEKMPTCKFFLEGMCHKEDCPYSHVKLSKDAPICREFLNGFCGNGFECDKRHQFLCPDFERDGNCKRRLCRYPHGKAVRPYKKRILSLTARCRKSKIAGMQEVKRKRVLKLADATEIQNDVGVENDVKRYYDCKNAEQTRSEQQIDDGEVVERPKLGALPFFISI